MYKRQIAPGAVVISGLTTIETLGMIALAGPLANLILSGVLNIAAFILKGFSHVLSTLALLNAFIAFFNLIPFGELDGRKILAWSPTRWILIFIISLILLIFSSMPRYLI